MAEVGDLSILFLTLRVAAVATLVILPIGVFTAWRLARRDGPGRTLVETLLSLPLVLPPTAVGLVLLEILGRSGPVGRILDGLGVEVLFTWKAVVVATAVMSFPLLVRPARAAFEEVDPRLLAMGRSLGSGPAAVFRRIAVPLAWRGILAGTLLAFSRALGEFGATIMIAGNIPAGTPRRFAWWASRSSSPSGSSGRLRS
jgi:molybdate transport system permease protein